MLLRQSGHVPSTPPSHETPRRAPVFTSRPTIWCPGMIASCSGFNSPATMCRSVRQTPQASTRSNTCPSAASGGATSSTASTPRRNTAARTLLLLVGDHLEFDDLLIAGAELDRLAERFVGAQKIGGVDDGIGIDLVPREKLIAPGRNAADGEVAQVVGDHRLMKRARAAPAGGHESDGRAVSRLGLFVG